MGYYTYTSDDLIEALDCIIQALVFINNSIEDADVEIDCTRADYDYYNGKTFYEDLTFKEQLDTIKNTFKEIDESLVLLKKNYNDKIKELRANADDRFKSQYENAEI